MDALSRITDFVFLETGLEPADVILIAGGARRQLMERAAELYHKGLAPLILPSGGANPLIPEWASEWEYLRDIGLKHGVPAEAFIKEDRARNTLENAELSLAALEAHGASLRRAILVCKAHHAMRAALTYQAVFPPEVEFSVVPVVDDRDVRRDNWFSDAERIRLVMSEVEKIGRYFAARIPDLAIRAERRAPAVHRSAGVVIVRDGKVALIRREHGSGKAHYLFPGGQVEPGETLEQAAVREAREELGLNVRIDSVAAVVTHADSEQTYFFARVESGEFGTGTGPQMKSSKDSDAGSYTAVLVDARQLRGFDVRPAALAIALADGSMRAGREPLRIED
ncbi:MAG: ElyC/SanA/YdcF family protein [Chloroflexota bacterium]